MHYSKLHGFVPRNPALALRQDMYNPPARFGYPRLRGERIVPNIRGGYTGLGGYISPEVVKKWSWDSFAVGLGAGAVTFMLGLLPSIIAQSGRKGSDPRLDQSIIPALLPAVGAGILGYLLRLQMDNCGVQAPPTPEEIDEATAEVVAMQQQQLTAAVITQCPQGQEWSPTQGRCVDILI